MFLTLDPAKLLIIAVVALVVLGPDKLPAAARKISSLARDLQRLRASLHEQVHQSVGDHPLVTELTDARDGLTRVRAAVADPRQTLYRSVSSSVPPSIPPSVPASVPASIPASIPMPGDLTDPSDN
jgi:sec-independent protein translocase protein TatB